MRHHMVGAAVTALTAVAVLAACGTGSVGLRATATGDGSSSLTVYTSLSPRADGAMYAEGALAEVRLRRPDGRLVAEKRAEPGRVIVFRGLTGGRYAVEPALRPCDGTCVHLDPRVDGCRKIVPVSGGDHVVVRFVVSQRCAVELPALQ